MPACCRCAEQTYGARRHQILRGTRHGAGMRCVAERSTRLHVECLVLVGDPGDVFGPAKYGLLPEILPARDLARANGLIEMSTFVAIILGTALGTAMFVVWYKQLEIIGLCLIAVAVAGTGASLRVPSVPPSGARQAFRLNPWGEICRGLRRLARESRLGLTVLGIAFFWLLAALMQMAVLLFGKEVMDLDDLRVGLLGTFLALGIGAGSLTAGRLSGQKVGTGARTARGTRHGHQYAAAIGLCVVVCPDGYRAGGARLRQRLVHRPLASIPAIQSRVEERGLLLATTNFLSMGAVLVASGVLWVCHDLLKWQADRIILLAGFGLLLGTIYVLRLLPAFVVRLVCWMLTHTLYRIRVVGGEHIPTQGPALLVCNHVSYVDGLLVGACMPASSVSLSIALFMSAKPCAGCFA